MPKYSKHQKKFVLDAIDLLELVRRQQWGKKYFNAKFEKEWIQFREKLEKQFGEDQQ